MTSTITMATATLPPASNNLFLLIERLFFFPMSFFAASDFVLSEESADQGMCPRCHSALIYKGDKHWDGIEFPFECAVCGAGGDLVKDENGEYKFVLAENGLIRDRNVNAARAEPSDQCYGGGTGNQTFYPGEKTTEADTGRQCAVQPAAEGAVRLCRGCRRCKACKFRL